MDTQRGLQLPQGHRAWRYQSQDPPPLIPALGTRHLPTPPPPHPLRHNWGGHGPSHIGAWRWQGSGQARERVDGTCRECPCTGLSRGHELGVIHPQSDYFSWGVFGLRSRKLLNLVQPKGYWLKRLSPPTLGAVKGGMEVGAQGSITSTVLRPSPPP